MPASHRAFSEMPRCLRSARNAQEMKRVANDAAVP